MRALYKFDEKYKNMLGLDIYGMQNEHIKIAGGAKAIPMKNLLDLTGKTAIVTGGAMGLGFCITNRLCEAGANVVIVDIADEFAGKALDFFDSKGYNVKYKKADVRSVAEINSAVDFTVKEFKKIDILINNAAHWGFNKFFDLSEESWEDAMDTNLKGTVFFTQAVAKQMVKQEIKGKVINVASVAGLSYESAYGCLVQYVASKSGVVGISQSLARELKPMGITINCVLPGGMLTPGAMLMDIPPEIKEFIQNNPSAPTTDPDEVARVVYMMATEISSFMHGATVVADGGAKLMIQQ